MIETEADLNRFQLENLEGDWILHFVNTVDCHPVLSYASILFIRNISTGKTYYHSTNHPDFRSQVDGYTFWEMLTKYQNRKWVVDKKAFEQQQPLPNLLDANLVGYLKNNAILDMDEYATMAHRLIQKNSFGHSKLNLVIPLLKHKEAFDDLADDIENLVHGFEVDTPFIRFNDLIIGTLGQLERQGIFVDAEKFKERFDVTPDSRGLVYSQYNVYTSTGRPSNRYGGVNYAALNQTDGTRSCFKSRFGKHGKLVLIDYTTFHPRIICRLTKYNIPINVDIYEYLAKLYFQKKDVDETDIKNSKLLTFRQLFGGVEEKYEHIKYLANLKTFIDEQWDFFKKNGYVLTPLFKRKITEKHIQDPNPSKVFNYILQAVEGEISIPKISTVLEYLKDKQTKAVLYTYDAVLYDYHKGDGPEVLDKIRDIMGFGGAFPLKTYSGDTYQDMLFTPV